MQLRQVPVRQEFGRSRPAATADSSRGCRAGASKAVPAGSIRARKLPWSVMPDHNQRPQHRFRVPMSSYKVRPAVDGDADAVAAVHAASSHAAYEGLVPDQRETLPMDKRRAFWRDAIEYSEPQVHVAIDDAGALVGFTGFDRSRDPKSKPTTGEIWALYVLPSHWNKGA